MEESSKSQEIQQTSQSQKGTFDGFKSLEGMLTAGNTVGIIATFAYLYKKQQEMEEKILKLEQAGKGNTEKIIKQNEIITQQTSLIKEMSTKLARIEESSSNADFLKEEVSSVRIDLDNIRDDLVEEGFNVRSISQEQKVIKNNNRNSSIPTSNYGNGHRNGNNKNPPKPAPKSQILSHGMEDLYDEMSSTVPG